MAQFEESIAHVLENEGGYVNHPNDPGGETNFGITKRDHPDVDIKNLTMEGAKDIYKGKYWFPIYERIKAQSVANKVLDMAVNMGHSQAHKILQRSLAFLGKHVDVDGVFGEGTIMAVNGVAPDDLCNELKAQCAIFYCKLATDPTKAVFLAGWLRRAVK